MLEGAGEEDGETSVDDGSAIEKEDISPFKIMTVKIAFSNMTQ